MYSYNRRDIKGAKISHFRHQMAALTAGISVAIVLTVIGGSRLHTAMASDAYSISTCYTSVCIAPGDTLWSIADEYMDSGWSDKESYIEDIRAINHLTDDDIQAGAYIVVPYTVPDL
ncbi:MAG: LysM peptidoglycan-binding domain-containing protein [Clostridiales bacterium]|nr:LysM peptidoglycan-binding domain-containing protein [Clostridiales bacterium]